MTKAELAARLKVSIRTVENWARQGRLPVVKFPRAVRFSWPAVKERLFKLMAKG
jgi:excisionase family DNA binding protein